MTRLRYVPLLASDLRALGACAEQVALFATRYPTGATPDDVTDATAAGLSVEWLVRALCDDTPALAEYERVRAPALAEYERVRAPAWAEYERVRAPALAEYERVRATALAEYERVRATALADALSACWPVWEGDR